ncbi:MAG TPA: cupin domain-containing protein [Tepidisphaeraceae bacterium]|jgi:oxalate decarboxylase|nr:cupin domain-containing protein [Tepidisphaeraceae bacterium]
MSSASDGVTRRTMMFQVAPAAAITAAGIGQAAMAAVDRSRTDPGPKNPDLDAQNPDSTWPPPTDSKSLVQNFKYPFSFANKRAYEGGWSREVTVRELPVSKSLAGVNMRLTPGGVRELHWHTAAEWSIMLYGTARITAVDKDGKSFVADVKKDDLWYFPSGIPHSIQGLEPDGAEFMLVFDDGDFSESDTVLLSDSMAHLPPDILSKNFGVAQSALKNLPKQELFILQTAVPGALEADQKAAAGGPDGKSPHEYAFRTMEMPPTKVTKGGEVRIVDSSTFKVSKTVAMAMVTVHPGGMRELHWHPNSDEWQYYISGKGRMTVVATGNKGRTMDFQAGDVGYVEKSLLHYIENTGDTDLTFLEMFKSSYYQDLSFSVWLTHTPPELVMAHLNIDKATLDAMPKTKDVIVPA